MKKTNVDKRKIKKYIFIFTIILIVILVLYIKYNDIFETKKTYTVVNGYVEKVSDTTGIFIKDEKVIDTDRSKSLITVVDQNKRVSKNGIIAIYKDESYDKYLSEVNDLDKTIETLIKDLPNTYSTEISNINQQISSLSMEARNETSYIKMQEYKNKLNELSYKKVSLLGEYSPTGSKIRELIEQREIIEKTLTNSSNNVISPISGVVSYKIDKLESVVTSEEILKFNEKELDELFSKYGNNDVSEYGVKVVNNFDAYFITKIDKNQNDEYIKEGKEYTIKTTEQDEYEFSGKLIKNISTDKYNYSIFKIENGIENIVDYRSIGIEIIWNRTEGLAVLKSSISQSEDKKYKYVTLVYGGQYIDIPVKIISSDENISIVENYTEDELKELGITSDTKLSLYDIIVVR